MKRCSASLISSVQLHPTLFNPMNHSTPGLPVHHQLPEFTQTHVHQVGDAIREMQIKTTVRYHLTPIKMLLFFKKEYKFSEAVDKLEPLYTLCGNVKRYSSYVGSTKQLYTELLVPAVPLLGINTKVKANSQRVINTPMFIAVLFTIAKTWICKDGC